jgi:cysteine synthase A
MSLERRKTVKALGAKLILTSGAEGMSAAIKRAAEIAASDPSHFVLLHQFTNPANPRIHFETTGPEIWEDTQGEVDVLVAGIGTGGTISGVSRYFKCARHRAIVSVGVEPAGSPVISQTLAGERPCPGPHAIQGLGAGFIPDTLDLKMVDRLMQATDEESTWMARRMAREEGILCGISSGAAVSAAVRIAREPEMEGKTIVVVLPDSGERYLSSPLFDGLNGN